MRNALSRREWLAAAAAVLPVPAAARPKGILVDTHIHLFASDRKRFPYHPNAVYKPEPKSLEEYTKFVRQAKIDHAVIVHPEPYQDDHSYLEHCFRNEPSPGFFKGTCLFDPIAPETPGRMEALVRKWPGRIVALRVHENQDPKKPPTTSGAIRDRDLRSPGMLQTWQKARALGIGVQMHFIPWYAPQIRAVASQVPELPVILDHLGRSSQGTPAEYEEVVRLADLPRVYMKFSGVRYSSRQDHPYRDVKPLVRRIYQSFGPDRILWGGLGMSMEEFENNAAMFDEQFDFAPESERAKIRGLNAVKLFNLQG